MPFVFARAVSVYGPLRSVPRLQLLMHIFRFDVGGSTRPSGIRQVICCPLTAVMV